MAVLTAIPGTVDQVAAAAAAGDTILLGLGDYTGAPLILSRAVTVVGQAGATVRRQIQPQATGVTLNGIFFTGPFQNGAAVYGYGAAGLEVNGCAVTGSGEQSIMLDKCDDALVLDCLVHDSGADAGSSGHHGIYVANSSRVKVDRLRVERVPAFGLQIGPKTYDAVFSDCRVDGCGQYGVTIWGGSARNVVERCSFVNTAKGVATTYQAGAGNVIRDCVSDKAWPSSLAGVALSGNTVGTAPPPPPPPPPDPEPDPEPPSTCEQKVTGALAELQRIRRPSRRVQAAIALLKG